MLPQTNADSEVSARTIYINPNFNKTNATTRTALTTTTHINPNFLLPRSSTATTAIHLNPQFLQKKLIEQEYVRQQLQLQQLQLKQQPSLHAKDPTFAASLPLPSPSNEAYVQNSVYSPALSCKLIEKSRMRIVREPLKKPSTTTTLPKPTQSTATTSLNSMIKLGRRKLMRSTLIRTTPSIEVADKLQTTNIASVVVAGSVPASKYKIDRRRTRSVTMYNALPLIKIRRRAFVARFALRRTSDFCTKRKINSSSGTLNTLSKSFKPSAVPSNKNLQMLNINGVLYKSTRNKLQRKDSSQLTQVSSSANLIPKSSGRALIVRGTRFILDAQGFKLTRIADTTHTKQSVVDRANNFKRIDIGGLTYVATSQNVFVRTGNHLARSHVNNAKQKSLQVLSRNLVKSNVPCVIFQRVGKCAAFERGKCRKVHDRRQVAVCSRFLRGQCTNSNCLLSHNISLSKMPVCKFFLQGVCVRCDCPYLHKKVGENTEICTDFLRGFCKLAEQCDKRHEFKCPDFERNGKCEKINCVSCKRKRQNNKTIKRTKLEELPGVDVATSKQIMEQPEKNVPKERYFIGDNVSVKRIQSNAEFDEHSDSSGDNDENEVTPHRKTLSRPKLGILPAYIPLA